MGLKRTESMKGKQIQTEENRGKPRKAEESRGENRGKPRKTEETEERAKLNFRLIFAVFEFFERFQQQIFDSSCFRPFCL